MRVSLCEQILLEGMGLCDVVEKVTCVKRKETGYQNQI